MNRAAIKNAIAVALTNRRHMRVSTVPSRKDSYGGRECQNVEYYISFRLFYEGFIRLLQNVLKDRCVFLYGNYTTSFFRFCLQRFYCVGCANCSYGLGGLVRWA